MKFEVNREDLLKVLQGCGAVVERRQTLPILSNLYLAVSESNLTITGTDLEVEIVGVCEVIVSVEGACTIPARKFLDICRALEEGSLLTFFSEGGKATIQSGRSRFSLATMSEQEFPRIEGGEIVSSISIPIERLKQLITQVGFAMAQQDVRYFLNGMLLEAEGEDLRAVATDGHRLALSSRKIIAGSGGINETGDTASKQAILPRKSVIELGRLLSDEDDNVEIGFGENHVIAKFGDFRLTSKLVEGQFPDYKKVLPAVTDNSLTGDRDSMKQGFQRVAILSNEKYRGVKLSLKEGSLNISANNPEQEEAHEEVAVQYAGVEMEIGFNVNYILDVLNVLGDTSVKISLADASSSALIESEEDPESVFVVMPMRL
jgi:DNA polymerase-3 subunit beta